MELRPLARGREDAAPAAGRPPRRRVPAVTRRRSQRGTASTRPPSRISLQRWSTSRSCRPRSPAAPPATTCSTRSASTCSSVSPRAAGSPPPAARTPNTSRHSPTRRASSCAGRNGCAGNAAWSWKTTISGLRWHTLATRRTRPSRFGSARWAWYFALADRVSEGRRFLELALSATDDDAPVDLRIEQLADLCYLATEEFDLGLRARGRRTRCLACRDRCGTVAARLRATDARARPCAIGRRRTRCHDGGRRGRRVRSGWRRLGPRSEQPHSRNRCGARRRRLHRHHDSLGRPPSLGRGRTTTRFSPRCCCSKGGRPRGAGKTQPRWMRTNARSSSPGESGSATTRRSLSPRSERSLSRAAICARAEELQRQALATAEAAHATLIAAQARVHLARIAEASGNANEADRLYREVLEWSTMERPHQARESLFVALAGNAATAAERGLAELAEVRPGTALT